jgi:L-ascorbate metabolism protein UlaG (beta-lactamase superfamily)
MRLEYLGHSAFKLTYGKYILLLDPFISGNPLAVMRPEALNPTHILVTHGHADHSGDALSIAARTGAQIIAPTELADHFRSKGAKAHAMYQGTQIFEFGKVRMTQALHGSSLEEGGEAIYAGSPCGYVIHCDGKCLYHAGDTGIFGDMELIGRMNSPIDCALLPIGGNFTMDPEEALEAANLLKPRLVVPMHYNTFPVIRQDADLFVGKLMRRGIKGMKMAPGDAIEL